MKALNRSQRESNEQMRSSVKFGFIVFIKGHLIFAFLLLITAFNHV